MDMTMILLTSPQIGHAHGSKAKRHRRAIFPPQQAIGEVLRCPLAEEIQYCAARRRILMAPQHLQRIRHVHAGNLYPEQRRLAQHRLRIAVDHHPAPDEY